MDKLDGFEVALVMICSAVVAGLLGAGVFALASVAFPFPGWDMMRCAALGALFGAGVCVASQGAHVFHIKR